MGRDDLSYTVAENITNLRKASGMTQAALAERLDYSDKSVSKWERAEGIPDVVCLKRIADLFGVTVDYLLTSEHGDGETVGRLQDGGAGPMSEAEHEKYVANRPAIVLLSISGLWLLAAAAFVIAKLCSVTLPIIFVSAIPATAILLIVFNAIWGRGKWNFFIIAALVWSVLFLVCYILRGYNLWLLMILGVPATVVVALACRVKIKAEPSK